MNTIKLNQLALVLFISFSQLYIFKIPQLNIYIADIFLILPLIITVKKIIEDPLVKLEKNILISSYLIYLGYILSLTNVVDLTSFLKAFIQYTFVIPMLPFIFIKTFDKSIDKKYIFFALDYCVIFFVLFNILMFFKIINPHIIKIGYIGIWNIIIIRWISKNGIKKIIFIW